MSETPKELQERIKSLEEQLATLRDRLDAQARTLGLISTRLEGGTPQAPASRQPPSAAGAPGGFPQPSPRTQTPVPPNPRILPRATTQAEAALEANLIGAWFARVGAVAMLLGAGFAFKYAVDRGLIGPQARVAIGVLAGILFIGWGEWSHRRSWPLLGQALGGLGISLTYLSLWAAFSLYSLIPQPAAFILLVVVCAGGAALALRSDSLALATLATLGGFLVPFLIRSGGGNPAPLYAYVLVLDVGVLALAYFRKWRVLDAFALAGTWISFALGQGQASLALGLGYSTAFFVVFTLVALAGSIIEREKAESDDVALVVANAVPYFVFVMVLLNRGGNNELQGMFTFLLGLFYLTLGLILREREPFDSRLVNALLGVATAFVTIGVAIQLDGSWIAFFWAIEALFLVLIGSRIEYARFRTVGLATLALSLFTSIFVEFEFGVGYSPSNLLVSAESLVFLMQIAVLYFTVWVFREGTDGDRSRATALVVVANVATLLWLSFEAKAALESGPGPFSREDFMFTLTAIWGLYAAGLLVVGVLINSRATRLLSVGLFALVVVKMMFADLWALPTGLRILAFTGLGAILLLGSLMFHRFRDFIMGEESQIAPG